jgi:hypothetical protein
MNQGGSEKKMNIVQPPAPPLSPELIKKFRAIVGEKYALTDAADIEPYVIEERDLYHGRSPLVLRPGSTAEVSAICELASEHRIALVPQGGNTGLVGGQTPHNGEVVVSMRRMDRIREVDTASNTGPARSTGCFRSRSGPKEAARSAAISRPTPAAPGRWLTGSRARWRSGWKSCWRTGAC